MTSQHWTFAAAVIGVEPARHENNLGCIEVLCCEWGFVPAVGRDEHDPHRAIWMEVCEKPSGDFSHVPLYSWIASAGLGTNSGTNLEGSASLVITIRVGSKSTSGTVISVVALLAITRVLKCK